MDEEPCRKPLLHGRGVLLFEDFCRSTGLEHATVERVLRTELLGISLWTAEEPSHPFGIFDDALPSRQTLVAMGLSVRDDYDPEALRSYDEQPEGDADDSEVGA